MPYVEISYDISWKTLSYNSTQGSVDRTDLHMQNSLIVCMVNNDTNKSLIQIKVRQSLYKYHV